MKMAQMFSSRAVRLLLVMALLGVGSCNNSGGGSAGDTISCGAAECRLVASDAFVDDGFGSGVGIAADIIAVGSPRDDDLGSKSGAVYVYRQMGTQWIEEQKLLADDGAAGDQFGAAIAVDESVAEGDLIVVGARLHDDGGTDAGAVYVFRFSGGSWMPEQKLTGDPGQISFGASVDVEDDLIVVGAPKDSDDGDNSGAVYVFRYNAGSWARELKIKPLEVLNLVPDPGDPPDNVREADGFGTAVSIDKDDMDPDEDVIAVGAPGDDVLIQRYDESSTNLPNADWQRAGTVYMFRSDAGTWPQEDRIFAQRRKRISPGTELGCLLFKSFDPVSRETGPQPDVLYKDNDSSFRSADSINTQFGVSVSVDDGVLAVGSSTHDRLRGTDANACSIQVATGLDTGSGYVYRDDGSGSWDFEAQIEVADTGLRAFIGESIDIDGETIVMSRRVDDQTATDAGAIYVFRYDGSDPLRWLEDEKVRASDGRAGDGFGGSLAVDGGTVIVGTAGTTQVGPLSGSAYAIDISP
jgi:hypothetical protein